MELNSVRHATSTIVSLAAVSLKALAWLHPGHASPKSSRWARSRSRSICSGVAPRLSRMSSMNASATSPSPECTEVAPASFNGAFSVSIVTDVRMNSSSTGVHRRWSSRSSTTRQLLLTRGGRTGLKCPPQRVQGERWQNHGHAIPLRTRRERWHQKKQAMNTVRRKNVRFGKPHSTRRSPIPFRRVIQRRQIRILTIIQPSSVRVHLLPTGNVGARRRCPATTTAAPPSAAIAYRSERSTVGISLTRTSRTLPPPIPVSMPRRAAIKGFRLKENALSVPATSSAASNVLIVMNMREAGLAPRDREPSQAIGDLERANAIQEPDRWEPPGRWRTKPRGHLHQRHTADEIGFDHIS